MSLKVVSEQPKPGRPSNHSRKKSSRKRYRLLTEATGVEFSLCLQAALSLCHMGFLSSVPLQNLSSCYHSSHLQLLTRSKHEGTRTNYGVRPDAQVLPLPQLLSTRRIGIAYRILHHGPPWLHELIQSADDGSTGWTQTLRHDLYWLDSFEPGEPSTFPELVTSLRSTFRNALKARLQRATTASILHQASQDDLTSLETFQQEGFGSIGIPIGPQDSQNFFTCEM